MVEKPFWQHLEELRRTLVQIFSVVLVGALIALFFYPSIFAAVLAPLGEGKKLVLLGPLEGLSVICKTAFLLGVSVTSPLWLYLLFGFVAPGLREKERRILVPFFAASLLFLCLGALFAYLFTIPFANGYLASINATLGQDLWSLSHYLDYTLFLLLANAVAFEACVVLFFLVHYGILSAGGMRRGRRGVVVAVFIASAVLTPPDVMTQLLLAAPLLVIYEGAIFYAKWREQVKERYLPGLEGT